MPHRGANEGDCSIAVDTCARTVDRGSARKRTTHFGVAAAGVVNHSAERQWRTGAPNLTCSTNTLRAPKNAQLVEISTDRHGAEAGFGREKEKVLARTTRGVALVSAIDYVIWYGRWANYRIVIGSTNTDVYVKRYFRMYVICKVNDS